jgi:prophage antirepressor-like protein
MNTFIFKPCNFELINYGNCDNIFFKARTVAKFLGYKKTRNAIKEHVSESSKYTYDDIQRKQGGPKSGPPLNNQMNTIYINEMGLYELIFGSKLEIAKQFREWVFKIVLPSIRKTGSYNIIKSIKPNLEFEIHTEYDLHKQIINFCKVNYPDILLIIANGELQNDTPNKREKSFLTGYEAGTFDIIITNLHKDGFNGLAIELKSPTGKGVISDKQLNIKRKYEENNYITLITNDYNKAILQIIRYMDNTRLKCLLCNRKFKNTSTRKIHYKTFHKIACETH